MAEIFERIGTGAETWHAGLQKLRTGRLLGRFFAASRQRLRDAAQRLAVATMRRISGHARRHRVGEML